MNNYINTNETKSEEISKEIEKIFNECPKFFFSLYKKDIKKEILEKTIFLIKNGQINETEILVFKEALNNILKIYKEKDIKEFLKENRIFEEETKKMSKTENIEKNKKIIKNLKKIKKILILYQECSEKIIKEIISFLKQQKENK
jgi:hypothetical protein